MTFIKIDLKTIKKNKDAGSTTTNFPGKITIKFEADILPPDFIDGKNIFIKDTFVNMVTGKEHYEGYINDKKLAYKYIGIAQKENKYGLKLIFERDIIYVEHRPIPDYSYEYKHKKVKCRVCGSRFDHEFLESDSSFLGDEEIYSECVCPVCGAWDCCDIEYETIEQALKRKSLTITKNSRYENK